MKFSFENSFAGVQKHSFWTPFSSSVVYRQARDDSFENRLECKPWFAKKAKQALDSIFIIGGALWLVNTPEKAQ
ncbi:MAG: hypothetical protein L6R45_11290 [Anaerolineae bacterium]|nr:hypothetical protein [Anaerolineae bacterium]